MIVSWFSCGNNSAVSSKLILEKYNKDDIIIARCVIKNEHIDSDRFSNDCEIWFNHTILKLASKKYQDCWDVWEKKKYISGIKGAPCTIEMKKAVRWDFEKQYNPEYQVFGFSIEEKDRANRFQDNNPEIKLLVPLIDEKLSKKDCANIIQGVNIKSPVMYDLGFKNNNCIGCAKATSIKYWAKTRHFFPEEFNRMAVLSRKLNCRLTRLNNKRIFLDEIPQNISWDKNIKENTECSLLCVGS